MHLNDRLSSASGRALADRGADYLAEHLTPVAGADPYPVIDHIGRAYAAERTAQGFGAVNDGLELTPWRRVGIDPSAG